MAYLEWVSIIRQGHPAVIFQAIFHPGNFLFSPAIMKGFMPDLPFRRVNQEGAGNLLHEFAKYDTESHSIGSKDAAAGFSLRLGTASRASTIHKEERHRFPRKFPRLLIIRLFA
jgi:hypothetical protein